MKRYFLAIGLTISVLGTAVLGAALADKQGTSMQQQGQAMQGSMTGGPPEQAGAAPMMGRGQMAAWAGDIYLISYGRLVKVGPDLEVEASVEVPELQPPATAQGNMGGGMMGAGRGAGQDPAPAAPIKNPVTADKTSIAAGKAVYHEYCAACHGPEGRGRAAGPSLVAADVSGLSDGGVYQKIDHPKPPMPNFSDILTAHQRWDVVNYLRTLQSRTGPSKSPQEGTSGDGTMGGGMMGRGMMGGGRMGDPPDQPSRPRGPMMGNRWAGMWGAHLAADSKYVYLLAGGQLVVYDHDLKRVRSKAVTDIMPEEQ